MNNGVADKYIELITRFVARKIAAADFERAYLDVFKSEKESLSAEDFDVLDRLFSDVDAYCGDPTLRGPEDLDEQQLREKCAEALAALARNRKVPA